MVTLRNPMFHPNLPSVQISNAPPKKVADPIRIPDPIPMPPNACQATITPISNGMYTIRNPYMSMMHQQSLMGATSQTTQVNPIYTQPTPQYGPNYVNPNTYTNPNPTQTYVIDPARSPKSEQQETASARIINLASFTQKSEDGYSLFNTTEEKPRFLTPDDYFVDESGSYAKPTVSPNPIGTRPNRDNKPFESKPSLFADPPPKEENDFGGFYSPFGSGDKFRSALFSDKSDAGPARPHDDLSNGDSLPYFQRLRVGAKLNSEVTIHHVNESKFYKPQVNRCPLRLYSTLVNCILSCYFGWTLHTQQLSFSLKQ